ncbi:helix-turn-helix domain-containing protein [Frigoribacterium faeni]|uniref:helix-turn-helix domain-containing protein n=1 Tax=Frigoribacterium faeni TaxID=145483 RepID=UPI00141AB2DF|nr:putative transcriptional regulator [Frigoribacterium faeni]
MDNDVRSRREGAGLTQAQLADLVGVSRQTIISIERGRYDPGLRLAFDLAAALEAELTTLFFPVERPTS